MKYYLLDFLGNAVGRSGEAIGSEYSLKNACKECGSGVEYIGRFKLEISKREMCNCFATLDLDYFISDEVYNSLLEAGCKVELIETENKTGKQLPFRHLISNFEFPQIYYSPNLRIEPLWQCKTCKKNGWIGSVLIENGVTTVLPYLFSYKDISRDFLLKSDIFITWERFGPSAIKEDGIFGVRFARPHLIISENVKIVLSDYSDDFGFEEIEINSIIE